MSNTPDPQFIPYATQWTDRGSPPDARARNQSMAIHLLSFCGWVLPLGHVLGPLIGWLCMRQNHWYTDEQGKEAVNFNITLVICLVLYIPLTCVFGVGFLLMIVHGIFAIVMTIIAAVRTSNGEQFRYPLTIRMVS
jgi:uncharacterized protein